MRARTPWVIVSTLGLAAVCSAGVVVAGVSNQPVQSTESAPTASPAPTATPTASPTATATPAPTPTPTPEPVSEPVSEPEPERIPTVDVATNVAPPLPEAPVQSAEPAPVVVEPAPVIEPAPAPPVYDWREGYVPCETPTGDTMTVGCYWDHDGQHYIVTDDGERFDVDTTTGERTYVDSTQYFEDGSWLAADGTHGCTTGAPCDQPVQLTEWLTMPTPDSIPVCEVEDDEGCYYPGLERGDACNWVNSPGLTRTWFFDCTDPALNGVSE